MLYKTHTHIYIKRMLIAQDYIKFLGRIAWQSFHVNNFADFWNVVRVKKKKKKKILFSHWCHFITATSAIVCIVLNWSFTAWSKKNKKI